jgi:tRNA 2-thiouridine synthesizing protein D
LCCSSPKKRNFDKGEAERNGKDSDNIEEGFRISGLGQLVEAGIQADRLITFGD